MEGDEDDYPRRAVGSNWYEWYEADASLDLGEPDGDA